MYYCAKIEDQEKEKMEERAQVKVAKAKARADEEEFRKFKKAFGLCKRRKKAARYSMRK